MAQPRRPSSTAPAPTRTRTLVAWLSLAVLAVALPQPASAASSSSRLAQRAQAPPALPQGVSPAGDYLCRIDADCQPCPPDQVRPSSSSSLPDFRLAAADPDPPHRRAQLDSPVCKLWGNRRPLSCIPRLAAPASHDLAASHPPTSSSPSSPDSARHPASTPPAPDPAAPAKSLSPAEQELRDVIDAGRRERRSGVVLVAGDSPEWALAARLARRAASREGARGGEEDDEDVEVLEGTTRGVQDVLHTWEACPKVLRQEYHDYFEFIVRPSLPPLFPRVQQLTLGGAPSQMCNVAFAVVGGLLLMYRPRTLALRQFGRLAARIMQTEIS